MVRVNANSCIQKNSQDESLNKTASWSGYNQSYIKNIVSGAMKALKLLSVLTFDPGLFFWTKGLENHLKGKIEEAKKQEELKKKYTFS